MKYFFYIISTVLLFIPSYILAKEIEAELINEYHIDVTGDGEKENIKLYGERFSEDTAFYRDIYAVITSEEEEWKINYQGGYEPVLEFIDLNHDGIDDLFYQSPTGGSGGLYISQLDTLAQGELVNIPLPKQEYVKGYFEQGFNVILEIFPNDKPIVIDVELRKEDYIRLGIYDERGNLLQATQIMVDPIAFYEPVLLSEKQGYGLKSFKQVSGAYHADGLGVIETVWYYENGKWMIVQLNWKEKD
ncbi:hypothetical protein [Oceanobacillus sp. CAU 1775]